MKSSLKIFLVIVSIVFSSSIFGQTVCGWVPIDSSNASEALKNKLSYYTGNFRDRGFTRISDDHSPWNNSQSSIEFADTSTSGHGSMLFSKAFNLNVGDSFRLYLDIKGSPADSVYIELFMVSNGKFYEGGCGSHFLSTEWKQGVDFGTFLPSGNGPRATRIDTVTLAIVYNSDNPQFPFNGKFDNFTYKTWNNGNEVVLDSMGENQAVEEEHGTLNIEHGIKVFPNPFCQSLLITGASDKSDIKVYDKTGKLVKSINDFTWDGRDEKGNKCSNGMYFLKVKTENRTITEKVLLIR
ncbi:MAG: T9SS type A sorting domain-containing protein [Patescibacteria group bacterium]|nr:T9SS type A sorting domain-containing protein [Patescibacteria group bacterium]